MRRLLPREGAVDADRAAEGPAQLERAVAEGAGALATQAAQVPRRRVEAEEVVRFIDPCSVADPHDLVGPCSLLAYDLRVDAAA
jgi:hypothetical protein